MFRISVIGVLLTLAVAVASPMAFAQTSSPFAPSGGPTTQTPAQTPQTTETNNNSGGGENFDSYILVGAGAVLISLFFIIGFFIVRDARGAIPQRQRGSLADHKQRDELAHGKQLHAKQRTRSKAKAARMARKNNR